MPLELYNTLSRRKEGLTPADGKKLRVYACGPTPYNYAHIGNFRTYVFEDVLRRYLEYSGLELVHVMNITDVDDKTIAGAAKQGISLSEYTSKFEQAFFEDLQALGIERPDITPHATEHVKEMIALIQRLLEKGVAYKGADGSVYFSVRKFKHYGRLSGLNLGELKTGARVAHDNYDKQSASDFALWKAWDGQDGEVAWDAPFGRGRPGWHVECSAMSMKYLGESFDLHCGGVDLIFPHHENEIAQSEGATGKQFARHWAHCEHLIVDGRKMSKSLGNFYTLRDVLAKGHGASGVRWLLLSTHYRAQLNFTFQALEAAQNTVDKLRELAENLSRAAKQPAVGEGIDKTIQQARRGFCAALDDDLNTPLAIAAVFELVREANRLLADGKLGGRHARQVLDALHDFDRIFNVLSTPQKKAPKGLAELAEKKIQERNDARKKGDYAKADAIRKELAQRGVVLEDTPKGTRWKQAR